MTKTPSTDLREQFLSYFENLGHKRVASGPLVPQQDPTLLFTNAGMNQFKDVFTGQESRSYQRAVSSQKCVRAGGKHNDLDNVGYTARHHTFFEMLGNFSFGDYFKEEAITYAWTFITEQLKLDANKLHVSVYHDDAKAHEIWKKKIGISDDHLHRLGEKDNFWSMGDVGPCGPCSEIYYDQGPQLSGSQVGDDGDRYLEFWNLVFMEFEQKKDGSRWPLPKPSIDTGMGLERITALLEGVESNYESSIFMPLMNHVAQMAQSTNYSQLSNAGQTATKVISDHIRCITFLVSEGIFPSNEGRGYVLRRIIRRAMGYGKELGFDKAFLHRLTEFVISDFAGVYPDLKKTASQTQAMILDEEQRFLKTLDKGLDILSSEMSQLKKAKDKVFSGETMFDLYQTYGFPVDMTTNLLRAEGLAYDFNAYEKAFEEHREKARGSWKANKLTQDEASIQSWQSQGLSTKFLGYDCISAKGKVLKLLKSGKEQSSARAGDDIIFVTDQSPFYGESGGQVGDLGIAQKQGCHIEIRDTQKAGAKLTLHFAHIDEGELQLGDELELQVNEELRALTAKNHTATHLLHATLIEVLGEHVKQKGSLVSPERLRFDFTQPEAVSELQLFEIEQKINQRIWENHETKVQHLPIEKAIQSGAIALFDEKYGEDVRVLSIGDFSKELCGGTHLKHIGEIGLFKIIKESSVSSGVRRIEALTFKRAFRSVWENESTLKDLSKSLKTTPSKLPEKIQQLKAKAKSDVAKPKTMDNAQALSHQEKDLAQGKLLVATYKDIDPKALRSLADRALEKVGLGVVVLGASFEEKAHFVVKVSKALNPKYHAGNLVKTLAQAAGGKGGGRPDMAQAGGPDASKIDVAMKSLTEELSA